MKAIIYTKYGPPEVLHLEEVDKPTPQEGEVLIKVHAASVNSYDWRRMRAAPFLVRLDGGLLKPKDIRLGADVAGRIEAVGSKVKLFKTGEDVFGDVSTGGYAEYVCAPEKVLALKPASVSFEEAAATPMAALTALQGLRDKAQVQPGQKVLVNGASGGVGTFAVQIARYYGAEVTGVCRTRNVEMVRSIGADHVIDYTKEDFTKNGQQYDLIFDVAANRSVFAYKRALAPKGKCVVAGFSTLPHFFHIMLLGPRVSKTDGQEIGSMGIASVNNTDLVFIGGLLESRKVVPVIDGRYPLNQTTEALRYFEEEHARGKVVITVEHDGKA
jgi:NADPH:quinone reductase-like Zn-dependent oxidoreductase